MELKLLLQNFLHLFFPRLCMACDTHLMAAEEVICATCKFHLPLTDFHLDPSNEMARHLWGKISFEKAFSMLHLAKSSRVESLLHRLKYKNQPEIGHFLGRWYAQSIKDVLQDVDMIVPIPIHPSKLRKRGYNQAAEFAKGLSEGLEIPLNTTLIIRKVLSVSQTDKSRTERYENVAGVFSLLPYISDLKNAHILLVDDVLTTGATIAEAGNLLVAAGAKVSIVTIARA